MPAPAGRRRADRTGTERGSGSGMGSAPERELAALVDGPWALRWYWRDELEDMQATSRRMGYPDDHPAAGLRAYRRTGERVAHPHHPDRTGRAWHHNPPQPATEPEADEPAVVARVAQAHQAVEVATAPAIPAPRRPRDDESSRREQLHRIHHHQQAENEETAQAGHEREGVLW